MLDIYADPATGDIVLDERGNFRWTETKQESVQQRCDIRLKTYKGEWEYNTSFGTPYYQEVFLDSGLDKKATNAIFLRVLSEIEDITGFGEIISDMDRETRTYKISSLEVFCNNEKFKIPLSDPKVATNTYPIPRVADDLEVCKISELDIEYAARLYFLVNYEMGIEGDTYPEIGDSTWWNINGMGRDPKVLN